MATPLVCQPCEPAPSDEDPRVAVCKFWARCVSAPRTRGSAACVTCVTAIFRFTIVSLALPVSLARAAGRAGAATTAAGSVTSC
eukprot:6505607-Prymnesium_polylepis.1